MAEDNDGRWVDGKLSFKLEQPVEAHGEQVTQLVLREPNGADIMEAGNPLMIDLHGDGAPFHFDDKKMGMMISRLASIPLHSVHRLQHRDFVKLEYTLAPFFNPFG